MIRNTFSMLNGIGQARERKLWSEGVLTWDDFLAAPALPGISRSGKSLHDAVVSEASSRLVAGDAPYFAGLMPRSEHWRLFDHFSSDIVCLDIESNGLPAGGGGYPTVVGLSSRHGFKAFIKGQDLSAQALTDALSGAKLLQAIHGNVADDNAFSPGYFYRGDRFLI